MKRLTGYTLVLGLLALAALTVTQAQPSPPPVGSDAPGFTLTNLDGEPVALQALTREGPVVLVVLRGYPGYQCPICSTQVAGYITQRQAFVDHGARVLFVYPGPRGDLDARAREFIQGRNWPANFELVTDPGYAMVKAYGLRWNAHRETAYPSTFIIDDSGTIRYAKVSTTHAGRLPASGALAELDTLADVR